MFSPTIQGMTEGRSFSQEYKQVWEYICNTNLTAEPEIHKQPWSCRGTKAKSRASVYIKQSFCTQFTAANHTGARGKWITDE